MKLIKNNPHHLATIAASLLLVTVAMQHVFSKPVANTTELTGGNDALSEEKTLPNANKAQVNAKQLANLHLFGKETQKPKLSQQETQPPPSAVDPENLPKSSIKLNIKGLFSHQDKTKGHAVIADKSGQDKSYRVGDKIDGVVTLHSIHQDYAVIKNSNRLERLELPEVELSGGNALFANRKNLNARQKRLADAKKRNTPAKEAIQ